MDYNHTGYNRIFNNFGYQELDRGIDVPDPALGIGFAEVMSPLPAVHYNPTVTKGPSVTPITDVTQTRFTGQGSPLGAHSFPKSGWLGDAIGGF